MISAQLESLFSKTGKFYEPTFMQEKIILAKHVENLNVPKESSGLINYREMITDYAQLIAKYIDCCMEDFYFYDWMLPTLFSQMNRFLFKARQMNG